MLWASVVTSTAQAVLAAYVALALWRGASTRARRLLARSLAWFAGYAATLGAFYVWFDRQRNPAFLANLSFAALGAADLLAHAELLARGESPPAGEAPPGAKPRDAGESSALPAARVLAVGLFAAGYAQSLSGRRPVVPFYALFALIVALLLAALGRLALAHGGGRRGARAFLVAYALPLVPLLGIVPNALGLVDEVGYAILRDVAMLAFFYLVLWAYLDGGAEPMSLRERLVAGSLALTLAVLSVAAHLAVPAVARAAASPAEAQAAGRRLAIELLGVLVLATALPLFALPRLLRRTVLEPLARLGAALPEVESGARLELPVEHDDELGRLTRSFNDVSVALADGRRASRSTSGSPSDVARRSRR